MKKFSKLFWVALVVVAVLACTAIGVFAAETSTAVIYADLYEVAETETDFSVDFNFKNNNTAVECGKITLTWDSAKLEVKSIAPAGELVGVPFGTKIEENGKAVIAWAGSEIDGTEGALFTVNFAKGAEFTADTLAAVEIAVDNFGYTEGAVPKELKDSVKTEKFLVSSINYSNAIYNGDLNVTPEEFLEGAIVYAKAGNVATVTLGKDMVFNAYTVIGTHEDAAAWAEGGKIKITSDGTYGIEILNKAVVVMYGRYEFSDMVLKADAGADKDNCLVFPDDSSAVFDANLTALSGKWINIAGNVTVNSGKYYFIAGNCKGSNVEITKPYNITMQGNAIANYVAGGMINGTGSGKVSAKANVQILDNALLYQDFCASGRYTGNDGTAGADVLICTTKKVPNIYAIVGTVSEASIFDIRIANVVDANVVSALISGKTGVGGAETTINWHLDGGTIKDFNGGLKITGTNTNESYIDGNINIYVNKREATLPTGCEYATLSAIPTFCAGSANLNGATGVEDRADRKLEVYAGTTISGVLYGGSKLSTADSEHKGDTEITLYGGTFSDKVYGGSYATATGTHSGNVTLNIYGGTFSKEIHGGSLLEGTDSAHGKYDEETQTVYGGEVTLTVRPAEGVALSVGSVFGGSNISTWGSQHWGNTTVYLKDINTRGDNNQTGSLQTTIASGAYICGGSLLWNSRVHSGNSELIIQRCIIDEKYNIFGGSRVAGSTAYHSGTSKLIIDGNTGLEKDADGKYTDVEVEGTNGYINLYENNAEGWFGGSWLEGASAKQTGDSCVEVIGTDNPVEGNDLHQTQIKCSWGAGIYGGCYYANQKVNSPQQNNSYVKITKTVQTANSNGVYAVGGSHYSTNTFADYTGTFVPTSKVIIDGYFRGRVIGGFRTPKDVTNVMYRHNSGVTLKSGTVASTSSSICPGSHTIDGQPMGTGSGQQGVALVEIYSGFYSDNDTVSLQYAGILNNVTLGLKLIGEFNNADNDGVFKLNLSNMTLYYLDLAQATGDPIEIYRNDARILTDASKIITPVNDKNIYFGASTATHSNGKLPATQQFEVNPNMTFAQLLGESGLKISNESTTSSSTNTLQAYSLYTKFDCVSSSPNAFKFYAADANGNATGEALTQIPANPSQQIIVKTGETQSAPTSLRHVFRMSGATLSLGDGIALLFKVNKSIADFDYENISAKVTFANDEYIIATPNDDIDANRHTFVFDKLTPAQMLEIAKVQFYANNNGVECVSQIGEYSVRTYCDKQLPKLDLTDDSYRKLGALMVDMLNYGAATQLYVNSLLATPLPEEEIELANKDLDTVYAELATTDDVIAPVIETFAGKGTSKFKVHTGEVTMATPRTAALSLQDSIGIQFVIGVDTTTDISGLKAIITRNSSENSSDPENGESDTYEVPASEFFIYDVNGNIYNGTTEIPTDSYGQYRYRIPFNELNPSQMNDFFYVYIVDADGNVVSNTMRYSIGVYATNKNDNGATPLGTLVKEMMKYGYSASLLY